MLFVPTCVLRGKVRPGMSWWPSPRRWALARVKVFPAWARHSCTDAGNVSTSIARVVVWLSRVPHPREGYPPFVRE
jgi:hypothetical protein